MSTAGLPFKRILVLLQRLGEVRDGLLVVAACAYVAGYASWAIYSHDNRLGPIPAIDAQYFVAGVPMIVAIGLGLGGGALFSNFVLVIWPRFYNNLSKNWQSLADRLLLGVAGTWFTALLVGGLIAHYAPTNEWSQVVVKCAAIVLVLLLPIMAISIGHRTRDTFDRIGAVVNAWLVPLLFASIAAVMYL